MSRLSCISRAGMQPLKWPGSRVCWLSHRHPKCKEVPAIRINEGVNLNPQKGYNTKSVQSFHTVQQQLHKGKATSSVLYRKIQCRGWQIGNKLQRTGCHTGLQVSGTLPPFLSYRRHFTSTAVLLENRPAAKKTKFSLNPIDDLQPLVQIPLLPQIERVVNPTEEEVQKATQLFRPGPKHKIEFVLSAPSPEFAPEHNKPEIAIMGRSNVGKSTLLRCLFRQVPDPLLVKTSKNPGHTKMANFFRVGRAMTMVDMPGYGYRQPADFVQIVESYLVQRKNLRMAVFMVDGAAGIASWDTVAIEMIEEFKRPYVLVMTKIDKVSRHTLLRNVLDVRQVIKTKTKVCLPQVFLVSGITGDGVPLLQYFFAQVTDSLKT